MTTFPPTFAAVLLAGTAAFAAAAEIPVDLSGWSEKGPASNGNWVVNAAGTSVTQTINGDPTFFVGPTHYLDTVLRGKIRVAADGDDDYIGFVLGYNGPDATGNDMDYVLLDWKQNDQSSGGFLAAEGFALSRVDGTVTNYLPGFWGHTASAGFTPLATNFGSTMGWVDNVEYSFEIAYRADRVTVSLTGGTFTAPTTVLDVAGNFPAGQFGFYNYSQSAVTYSGFTLEQLPPTTPAVPEPETYALMALGLAAVALVRRRKRRGG